MTYLASSDLQITAQQDARIVLLIFSIAHGGRFDIEKYVGTATHKRNAAEKPSKPLTSCFKPATAEDDQSVILAECLFTSFLVEQNIPISAADHVGPLFRKMFPGTFFLFLTLR